VAVRFWYERRRLFLEQNLRAPTSRKADDTVWFEFVESKIFSKLVGELSAELATFNPTFSKSLRVTRIQAPRPPKAMSPRDIALNPQKLNGSQAVFAMMLNISPKTVQAWEQGSREPGDAALKLLTIAKNHPEVLLET
jgi:DNA-binding transcriptional regulator YiaG